MPAPGVEPVDARLARLAAEQFGVFSLDQAFAFGWSSDAIKHRVRSGQVARILPRVYVWAAATRSWHALATAASLWAGRASAISHSSAARLYELLDRDHFPIHVSLVGAKRSPNPRVRVHRVDEELLQDLETVGPVTVTSPRRTLLDLAAVKHFAFESVLDRALRQGTLRLQDLAALYEERWVRGRKGIAILGAAVRERTPGLGPTQSDMEDLFVRVARRFDLPEPQRQYRVGLSSRVIHVDFAYPEPKVAIECDGLAWHLSKDAFEKDRRRDIELQMAGWVVLRFTWTRLRWQPEDVAREVREALRLGGRSLASQG